MLVARFFSILMFLLITDALFFIYLQCTDKGLLPHLVHTHSDLSFHAALDEEKKVILDFFTMSSIVHAIIIVYHAVHERNRTINTFHSVF